MDLLVSTLGGMECILGMEFITQNNVLIEGHNRIVRIPSKSGIVQVKAHELPCVGDPTIRFMVGKTFKKECVGDPTIRFMVGKAFKKECVGDPTIRFMVGKAFKKECVGDFGMMCVMRVLDEYEPKEVTKLVTSTKCIKQVLEEFPYVMPEELPPRRRVATLALGSRPRQRGCKGAGQKEARESHQGLSGV